LIANNRLTTRSLVH